MSVGSPDYATDLEQNGDRLGWGPLDALRQRSSGSRPPALSQDVWVMGPCGTGSPGVVT